MNKNAFLELHQSKPSTFASYRGTGAVEMASGLSIPVEFDLLQLEDGDCFALCSVIEPVPFLALVIYSDTPERLVGVSQEGRHVEFSGNLIATRTNNSYIELHGQFITVSGGSVPSAAEENQRVCAIITNAVCLNPPGSSPIKITADPKFHATISARVGYEEMVSWLSMFKGIRATAEAQIEIVSQTDLSAVEGYLFDLCVLLSFAQGTRVAWIRYDLFDSQGAWLYTKHGRAVTGRYSSMPVLPKNVASVEQFLNQCLQPYRASRSTLDLKLVIDMITAAKQEGNYLEARALQLVATMEFIKGRVLLAGGKLTIMDNGLFAGIQSSLQQRVKEAVTDLLPDSLSNDQVRQLSDHVQGLNWYPFRAALRDVDTKYSVGLTSKELQKFIAIRNKLVHEYSFDLMYGTQMDQFHFLESILSRIVLSVLQYRGEFYDWSYHIREGSPRLTHFHRGQEAEQLT